MQISQMKTSKYVKKEDVGDGMIVTIDKVTNENVAMDSQPPENKYILHFKEDILPLVLNWTNIQLVARATGTEETDEWPGKQIVLWNDPNVSFGGNLTGGVRVRANQQSQPVAAPVRAESERNPPANDFDDSAPF